mgnify:FL=1
MITREAIEKRIGEMRVQHSTLVANIHALEGAIQDSEFWLTQLSEARPENVVNLSEAADVNRLG